MRKSIICCAANTTGFLRFSRSRSSYWKKSVVRKNSHFVSSIEELSSPTNGSELMGRYKVFHVTLLLVFCSSVSVFGQWNPVGSGTTNNLNGVYLLDFGTGLAVGEAGTILK